MNKLSDKFHKNLQNIHSILPQIFFWFSSSFALPPPPPPPTVLLQRKSKCGNIVLALCGANSMQPMRF